MAGEQWDEGWARHVHDHKPYSKALDAMMKPRGVPLPMVEDLNRDALVLSLTERMMWGSADDIEAAQLIEWARSQRFDQFAHDHVGELVGQSVAERLPEAFPMSFQIWCRC
jgi:hypothetical protein